MLGVGVGRGFDRVLVREVSSWGHHVHCRGFRHVGPTVGVVIFSSSPGIVSFSHLHLTLIRPEREIFCCLILINHEFFQVFLLLGFGYLLLQVPGQGQGHPSGRSHPALQ